MKKGQYKNLAGLRFGRWQVISFSHTANNGATHFECKCDCGRMKIVRGSSLLRGESKSCSKNCGRVNTLETISS
jgi:hypothetical protein